MTDVNGQLEVLGRGVDQAVPENEFRDKLRRAAAEGRPLRVKYGIDPTGISVHLGHTVPLRKLRQFQDLGHTAVIIIGNYTALVGDPSGRDETRSKLTEDQVAANAKDYLAQVGKIIDLGRAEVHHNGDWFSKWSFLRVLDLTRHMTLSQISARDDFAKRIAAEKPVYLHECLYPLMQGWDSVEVRADIELGGSEQLFSLLVARDLQVSQGQAPQVALTMPILVGTDGVRRMGKSLGNYIGVAEDPNNMFGKVMSIPDDAMRQYFTLLTDIPLAEVDRWLGAGVNPRDAKEALGRAIVTQYWGADLAEQAARAFRKRSEGHDPDEIPEVAIPADQLDPEGRIAAPRLIVLLGLESSTSNARRVIEQGGVTVGPERTAVNDTKALLDVTHGLVVRVGKRKIARVGLEGRGLGSEYQAMANHGIGIIGCGMIAEFHTRAILEIPGARVAAVFDRHPERARKIADLAGNGCRTYGDLDGLIADPEIDVVSVCTPSGAHKVPSVSAARAGKHVVVEKPLEITLPRCDAIINACDEAGVRLCTIFPSRYSAANQALKTAIDTGRFGRLTLGDTSVKWWRTQEYYDSGGWRGTWELDGGGALMNQAIHNVDLLQWLMGDVESVHAMTSALAHLRIEVEDTAVAILRFKSGALGVIEAATSAYPGLLKRTEIHGDGGSARVEQDDITLWDFRLKAPSDSEVHAAMARGSGFSAGASDPRGINHVGHRDQIADFLGAIDDDRAPFVDGREGRKSVEIIRAAYHSAQTGQTVQLPFQDRPESKTVLV